MDHLKIRLKEKEDIEKSSKELSENLGGMVKFLENLTDSSEYKKIKKYNSLIDESPYKEEDIISNYKLLCDSYDKAISLGDSYQVWIAIPEDFDSKESDNECLMANKVHEAPDNDDAFNAVDIYENKELITDLSKLSIGSEYYIPNHNMCSWFLVEPQILVDNLHIELNGVVVDLDFLKKYIESKPSDRLDKDQLLSSTNEQLKSHLDSGGIVFDTTIYINKKDSDSVSLDNLKDILDNTFYYSFLSEYLYNLSEDEDFVLFSTDKRILDNSERFDELVYEVNTALEIDLKKCKTEKEAKVKTKKNKI